jgi:hypothetical protein
MENFIAEKAEWPIFVIGSYRSGSTLLRVLLDAHEHLACPPESKFLAGLAEVLSYPEAFRALLGMGLTKESMMRHMGRFVDSVFAEAAHLRGKPRWIDKTPNYYKLLPFIDELFASRVLYVTIVRHPLDCIDSMQEFMSRFQYHENPDLADNIRTYGSDRYGWAKLWCHIYERIYVHMQGHLDRVHFIKYEDMVSDTERSLRHVLEFMGEDYSEGMIDRAFHTQKRAGVGDSKIWTTNSVHKNSLRRWDRWPKAEAAALWNVVQPVAALYGYESY